MLFNSLQFLVFFAVVIAAYFSIPHRLRWVLILLASCYFYMVFVPVYILILLAVILIDYGAGLLLQSQPESWRKPILVLSLVSNIGMLAFFKYFNFLNGNLSALLRAFGLNSPIPHMDIILPIGLSFHTFQSMSYTIEVYLGRQKAERHLGLFAAYVLFFPQLVAGPIERPQHLLPQFYEKHVFEYRRVIDGFKLMVWGFFQKMVIADRLAIVVDNIYTSPGAHNGGELAVATYFFAFQIFCDFSGYCDIAIGVAQVMGFNLRDNFNRPYFSKSIPEFWKRWHISLSTWFRDYLYIPLGGNRVSQGRLYFNLMFVFLVSGLWHGANWTFVLWGAMHGAYLLGSLWTAGLRGWLAKNLGLERAPGLRRVIQVAVTFHLATFAWIAFRAASISDAWLIMRRILDPRCWGRRLDLGVSGSELSIASVSIGLLLFVHLAQRHQNIRRTLSAQPAYLRGFVYAAALLLIALFGKFDSESFIYFQF